MTTLTNFLAQLLGITIVITCLSFLINQNYLKRIFSLLKEDEKFLFCAGLTSFIVGLAIVLSHNVWEKSWHTIITVWGWLSLIKGFLMLIFPEGIQKMIKKVENQDWVSLALLVILLAGLLLTYLGFTL